MKEKKKDDVYSFELKEGRVKIRINGALVISFLHLDYLGLYSSKEENQWYNIDFIMKNGTTIETYWNDRVRWLKILELIDKNL